MSARPREPGTSSITPSARPVGSTAYAVGVFHRFRPPPWGGGNQFLLALRAELRRRGVDVFEATNFTYAPPAKDRPGKPVKKASKQSVVYLANAITFDKKLRQELLNPKAKFPPRIPLVHRLDGPYYAARFGKDPRTEARQPWRAREDDEVYRINARFACATVFQSQWSMAMNKLLGYTPQKPVRIIPNAADPAIFHSRGRTPWERTPHRDPGARDNRVRVLTSAWSDGPRKGYDTILWLDKNLDFTKYRLELYGRPTAASDFKNVVVRKPVDSYALAEELRESADIFLTPSRLEPCSNSVVEALASGLPVVYQRGSGHDELVQSGGIGFDVKEEISEALDRVVADYKAYQGNISAWSIERVASEYADMFDYCHRERLKHVPR